MKCGKLKRNFWLSAEIECMLSLIKELRAEQTRSTTTTHYTFTQIANKMKKRGFPNKSPTQIRRKWFQMKSAYLCYKKGNVERLFLIPEKFRSDIAQFVEDGNKIGRPRQQPQQSDYKKVNTPMDNFVNQLNHNNTLLIEDFNSLQESLMHYEHKCQSLRDYNIIKYIST
ncbi:uncharacterized protein LOC115631821 isoform X2 [Scaptodrosophila lebanonensis]|uniref:Uncharacterized protein LOC115631821 isoform X2 n=1 Tax=Drosophila lebanonensis TaxID=7225 RepID=A0A6J2U856_DROLE|nr:uncharacterized protein LOC115631821 isoform X2 [Scaptodrosophila lebanonensis]